MEPRAEFKVELIVPSMACAAMYYTCCGWGGRCRDCCRRGFVW